MSYDLVLSSPSDRAASRCALIEELRERGWYAVIPRERDSGSDALSSGDVYAARKERDAGLLSQALEQDRVEALAPLFEQGALALCTISVKVPYSVREELESDELRELLDEGPQEVTAALLGARSRYFITTSAGRTEASLELQMAVWKALGDLVLGILEDPQEGTSLLATPDGTKEFDRAAERAQGNEVRFFDRLRSEGMPVDGMNLRTERLTRDQAERVAALMLSHFGKDEGYRMAVDMLRAFIRHQAPDFGVSHAAWLRRVNRRFDMCLDVESSTDGASG